MIVLKRTAPLRMCVAGGQGGFGLLADRYATSSAASLTRNAGVDAANDYHYLFCLSSESLSRHLREKDVPRSSRFFCLFV